MSQMTLVQKLAENPLGDLKRKADACVGEHDGQADETVLLEQTLSKISGLLQVGFGMAGSEVIGKSMSIENDGEFNYMLAGETSTLITARHRALPRNADSTLTVFRAQAKRSPLFSDSPSSKNSRTHAAVWRRRRARTSIPLRRLFTRALTAFTERLTRTLVARF